MEFLRVEDDDKEFRAHYRVPYSVFQAVLKRIRHRIERDDKEQIRSSGAPIDAETMLAVTLRWLAGLNTSPTMPRASIVTVSG